MSDHLTWNNLEVAAKRLRVSLRTIYDWIKEDSVRSKRTKYGLFVCMEDCSFRQRMRQYKKESL